MSLINPVILSLLKYKLVFSNAAFKARLDIFATLTLSRDLGQYAKICAILKFNLAPVFVSKILRSISSKNSTYQAWRLGNGVQLRVSFYLKTC
jgi:hypothetical protein